MSEIKFVFEELTVWQKSLDFAEFVINAAENINTDKQHFRLLEQLEASSTSIASNIAEGKGRYSKKEFIQYLYIARGSLFETVTLLELFKRKRWISGETFEKSKMSAEEINKMISSLVKAIRNSLNR